MDTKAASAAGKGRRWWSPRCYRAALIPCKIHEPQLSAELETQRDGDGVGTD